MAQSGIYLLATRTILTKYSKQLFRGSVSNSLQAKGASINNVDLFLLFLTSLGTHIIENRLFYLLPTYQRSFFTLPALTVMIFARDVVTNLRRKAWEYLVKPDRGGRHCVLDCSMKVL